MRRASPADAPGVLQGTRTYVLQDEAGNIELTHSVSAGLDYAAVGPEHAWLRSTAGPSTCTPPTPKRSTAFGMLARLEGILPALESAHAIAALAASRPRARAGRDRPREPLRDVATRTCRRIHRELRGRPAHEPGSNGRSHA